VPLYVIFLQPPTTFEGNDHEALLLAPGPNLLRGVRSVPQEGAQGLAGAATRPYPLITGKRFRRKRRATRGTTFGTTSEIHKSV
jgi:hypothetical protein